ncbi:MAG: cation transporter, partial [Magnetococcales bacterium]|nr:cation transporter [Magnetococcales bacterium]
MDGEPVKGPKCSSCASCVEKGINLDISVTVTQAVLRMGFASASGSMALMAQAIYSLADSLTKIINAVSIRIARRPPSKLFPYGYGKIQFITSAIIGIMLLVGAGRFLFDNFTNANDHIVEVPGGVALIGVALSGVISLSLSFYLGCVARENRNPVMKTAALDNRIDALSSAAVFLGVVIARLGWPEADNWMAMVMSMMVIWIGGKIAFESLRGLMDISIPGSALEEMERMARLTPGVLMVEYCRGRVLGDTWEINLQIAIDDTLTTPQGYALSQQLRSTITHQFPN